MQSQAVVDFIALFWHMGLAKAEWFSPCHLHIRFHSIKNTYIWLFPIISIPKSLLLQLPLIHYSITGTIICHFVHRRDHSSVSTRLPYTPLRDSSDLFQIQVTILPEHETIRTNSHDYLLRFQLRSSPSRIWSSSAVEIRYFPSQIHWSQTSS